VRLRRLGTDMRLSLRRNVLWQVLQTGCTTGTELVVLMALAGYLGTVAFGAVAVTLSACKIGFMVVEPRIHEFLSPKLARYAGRHPLFAARWSIVSVRIEAACNGSALTLCLLGGALAHAVGIAASYALVAASALYLGSNTLLKFSSVAIYRCIGRVDVAAWYAVAGAVSKLAAMGVAMAVGCDGAGVLASMTLPSLATAACQAWIARRRLRLFLGTWPRRSSASTLRPANRRRQLRLILANYGTGFVEVGHRELDVQILAFTSGGVVAGSYRLVKSMAMLMLEVLNPVVLVLLPEFSRRLAEQAAADLAAFVRRVMKVLGSVAALAALGVLTGMAAYFHWIAPNQARDWLTIIVLVAGLFVMSPMLWAQAFLVARDRPHVYLRASALGAALAAVVNLVLSSLWGATGAAVGHVTGLLVTNSLGQMQAMREIADLRRAEAPAP
jgi:O-antigen/teichoic acid export membrane protein